MAWREFWRERKSLLFGSLLALLVAVTVIMSMTNHIWRERLEKLQTLAGGLAVLAGAMFAHDGHSAAAREARRKDQDDKDAARRNLLLKAEHAAMIMVEHTYGCLDDLSHFTEQYTRTTLNKIDYHFVTYPLPGQLMDCWEHLSCFPVEAIPPFRKINRMSYSLSNLLEGLKIVNAADVSWIAIANCINDIYEHSNVLYCILSDTTTNSIPGTAERSFNIKYPPHKVPSPPDRIP